MWHVICIALVILAMLALGWIVYWNHPEGSPNRIFFFFTMTLALLLVPQTYFITEWIERGIALPWILQQFVYPIMFVSLCFLPALFLHLFLIFPERAKHGQGPSIVSQIKI